MIHQYKNNGYNIVLDVNSGSVHVVDDLSYDLIALAEEQLNQGKSKEQILDAAKQAFHHNASEEDIAETSCE